MTSLRWTLGVTGVALMIVGAVLVAGARDALWVPVWLAGMIVAHDGLIVPFVLLVGALLVPLAGRLRGPVRGTLLVAGAVTAVALPVLLRPGTPANPSVLPLDYPRNWLVALAGIALAGALVAGFRRVREVRRCRRPATKSGD